VSVQEAERVIDKWSQYPAGEFIPLMKHMFDYSIRTVLMSLYGLSADDEQLISTIHASYDVVSDISAYTLNTQTDRLLSALSCNKVMIAIKASIDQDDSRDLLCAV